MGHKWYKCAVKPVGPQGQQEPKSAVCKITKGKARQAGTGKNPTVPGHRQ